MIKTQVLKSTDLVSGAALRMFKTSKQYASAPQATACAELMDGKESNNNKKKQYIF